MRHAARMASADSNTISVLDFRRHSKVLNTRLKKYDFGFGQLLR